MIRFRLAEVLAQRGWTAYRLAQESGLTVPATYRLAKRGRRLTRIEAATLERLCLALDVQPGQLLEWVPMAPSRRRR